MIRKIQILCCLVFLSTFSLFAQYTETINSNRPGSSQGAFAVGNQVLQFELGLGLGKEKHELLNSDANAFTIDYAIRYGFLKERLEVNAIGTYQRNSVTITQGLATANFNQANFKINTLGAKYLLYDPYRKRDLEGPNLYSWKANNKFQWRDLIPAISVYAGANLDFSDNPFTPELESSISPKLVISTQNNWSGGWVFVTNIIVDRVTTDFPSYGYILTLTHAFNEKISVFAENQALISDFYSDQLFRGGGAYLISNDLQLDASFLLNFKDTPSRTFGYIGVSYRIDMHKKDEFIEEKSGSDDDSTGSKKDKKKKKRKSRKRKDDIDLDDDGGSENLLN